MKLLSCDARKAAAAPSSELGHGGVERFLSAAEDEDEGPFLDEALCRGATDAGSAAGDHGGFPFSLVLSWVQARSSQGRSRLGHLPQHLVAEDLAGGQLVELERRA
jgi:hypothetical protein